MRTPRRLLLICFGAFAGLVVLEIALQAIAWWTWSARHAGATPAQGARSVLCVGDSFTYGLGAVDRENAYPAVAQRALADLPGEAVHVVNLGWPGRDSAGVLGRLPEELARLRPRLVYVLIGYNDFWSGARPAAVESAAGFPLELRTLRLFRMIVAALTGGPPAQVVQPSTAGPDQDGRDAPFLGPWHAGPVFLDFRADGTIDTPDGPFDGVWSQRGERILIEMRETGALLESGFRLEGDRLRLDGGPFGDGLVLQRGLPMSTPFERGRAAARAGDVATAEREWREAIDVPGQEFDARLALTALLDARGDRGAALAVLGGADVAARASARSTARFCEAALAIGELDLAFARIIAALRDLPIDGAFVTFIVRHALRAPDRRALDAAIAERLAREDVAEQARQGLLGLRVSLEVDPDAALDALVELSQLEPLPVVFEVAVRREPPEITREVFVARVQALPAAARDRAIAAFDRSAAVEDRTSAVLASNLRAIVITCRAAGAEPVLMTYPGSRDDVARVVRTVIAELDVGLVDHHADFAARFGSAPRELLFIADGHCNDRGYVEMGERVAQDARRRLR